MSWTEQAMGIIRESQGPFAPEVLNPGAQDDVWSRRFENADHVVDVYAAPTIPASYTDALTPYDGPYDVTVCTEVRDLDDDGGDTSDYHYEIIANALDYADAAAQAERFIRNFDTSRIDATMEEMG